VIYRTSFCLTIKHRMLIVCDSKTPAENRSWLNTFQSTINLSPHSRIALTSATFPMRVDTPAIKFEILDDPNNYFTFELTDNATPGNSQSTNVTIPAGTYTIDQLIYQVNTALVSINLADGAASYKAYASFGWDKCCQRFYFNIQVSQIKDANLPLDGLTINLSWTSLAYFLGFFFLLDSPLLSSGLTQFGGYLNGVCVPFTITQAYQDFANQVIPIYVSLPSFQIYTPVSANGLRNAKSIVHSIFVRPADYVSLQQFLDYQYESVDGTSPVTVVFRVNYLPPLHQYVEVNNDAITPVNDLLITLLDAEGRLNTAVTVDNYPTPVPSGITQRVIVVFELETEPEKVQEALREVKHKLRFDKFMKNHEYRSPL